MEFDYSMLRGKIREKYGTERGFANVIGMNPSTLSLKLSNKLEFSQQDIIISIHALQATSDMIEPYFFTPKVAKWQKGGWHERHSNFQQSGIWKHENHH